MPLAHPFANVLWFATLRPVLGAILFAFFCLRSPYSRSLGYLSSLSGHSHSKLTIYRSSLLCFWFVLRFIDLVLFHVAFPPILVWLAGHNKLSSLDGFILWLRCAPNSQYDLLWCPVESACPMRCITSAWHAQALSSGTLSSCGWSLHLMAHRQIQLFWMVNASASGW